MMEHDIWSLTTAHIGSICRTPSHEWKPCSRCHLYRCTGMFTCTCRHKLCIQWKAVWDWPVMGSGSKLSEEILHLHSASKWNSRGRMPGRVCWCGISGPWAQPRMPFTISLHPYWSLYVPHCHVQCLSYLRFVPSLLCTSWLFISISFDFTCFALSCHWRFFVMKENFAVKLS